MCVCDRWAASLIARHLPFADRRGQIAIFAAGLWGGIIFRPHVARLRCASPWDGQSRHKRDGCACKKYATDRTNACNNWCRATNFSWDSAAALDKQIACGGKAWRPADLSTMLAGLRRLRELNRTIPVHNEFVLDATHPAALGSEAVEAFFYPTTTVGACNRTYCSRRSTLYLSSCRVTRANKNEQVASWDSRTSAPWPFWWGQASGGCCVAQAARAAEEFAVAFGVNRSVPLVELRLGNWQEPFAVPKVKPCSSSSAAQNKTKDRVVRVL